MSRLRKNVSELRSTLRIKHSSIPQSHWPKDEVTSCFFKSTHLFFYCSVLKYVPLTPTLSFACCGHTLPPAASSVNYASNRKW